MAGARRVVGTLLVLLAVLLVGGFAFVLYDQGTGGSILGLDPDLAAMVLAGILGAIIVILFLLLVIRHRRRKAAAAQADTEPGYEALEPAFEEVDEAGEPVPPPPAPLPPPAPAVPASTGVQPDPAPRGFGQGPEVVVYDLPQVERAYRSWTRHQGATAYTYPRAVPSAIYSNDYVEVGGGQRLKLRTLLAGPSAVEPLPAQNATPATPQVKAEDLPEPYRSRLLPAAKAVPRTGKAADGEAFVARLAEAKAAPKPKAPPAKTYYGYPGDVHPVEAIEGIGALYGHKLRAAGVLTTDRLCYEDPQRLGDKVGVPRKTVETWQSMAELVKVKGVGPQFAEALARAGVDGIAELKRRSPTTLTEQVNAYLDSLQATVVGSAITAKRIESWQKAAAKMKRVRLQVPEN